MIEQSQLIAMAAEKLLCLIVDPLPYKPHIHQSIQAHGLNFSHKN